jgi:hypothetical protein
LYIFPHILSKNVRGNDCSPATEAMFGMYDRKNAGIGKNIENEMAYFSNPMESENTGIEKDCRLDCRI